MSRESQKGTLVNQKIGLNCLEVIGRIADLLVCLSEFIQATVDHVIETSSRDLFIDNRLNRPASKRANRPLISFIRLVNTPVHCENVNTLRA